MGKRSANLDAELKIQMMKANNNIEREEKTRVLVEQEKVEALEASSALTEELNRKITTLTEQLDRRRSVKTTVSKEYVGMALAGDDCPLLNLDK